MPVEIVVEDKRWTDVGLESLCTLAVEAVLNTLDMNPTSFTVEILACDDARIADLNWDFRGQTKPTNVLSWPSVERAAPKDGDTPIFPCLKRDAELGDIAISYDTCAREADQAGKPFADHLLHLIVHATLHLLGYDHQRDQDATLMERIEVMTLGKLGVDNPYWC
ncbi:MAG: rRNA maturation RNase YbeY [Marinovum sp.]|nr:rRNA maturation RNase YbeY [Marinovum sp.]MBT6506823.1 rRNA maturation RNase YbeY [Marinovum sp.]MBT6533152.1 rRNA maturation RNase YbeY [Marinovum sp.]